MTGRPSWWLVTVLAAAAWLLLVAHVVQYAARGGAL